MLMYSDVLRWMFIPAATADTRDMREPPRAHLVRELTLLASYFSLVDKRCRDFIHWVVAASV
jgi:hypothetical protein